MKIVATISDDRFLVEATKSELSSIAGFQYVNEAEKAGYKFPIGCQFNVSELWAALAVSRSRKTEIAAMAESLRKVAGRIDGINQALAAPIVEVQKP